MLLIKLYKRQVNHEAVNAPTASFRSYQSSYDTISVCHRHAQKLRELGFRSANATEEHLKALARKKSD